MLFKQAFDLISCKQHLTLEGLEKLVEIKASLSGRPLSNELKTAFPHLAIIPAKRFSVLSKKNIKSFLIIWI